MLLRRKRLPPGSSCPLSLVFSLLVLSLTPLCSRSVPQEPCGTSPPPISCSTKSPITAIVFSGNWYKLVGKIKWDCYNLFFKNQKCLSHRVQHINLVKHRSALPRKRQHFSNAFDLFAWDCCNHSITDKSNHNSTASHQITLVSPTKTFYPTLLNSAYHLNHVSYKEQMCYSISNNITWNNAPASLLCKASTVVLIHQAWWYQRFVLP